MRLNTTGAWLVLPFAGLELLAMLVNVPFATAAKVADCHASKLGEPNVFGAAST